MRSMNIDRRNRLSWAVGVSLALATGSVLAETPNAAEANPKGVMTFPNVRVVNAPVAQTPTKSPVSQGVKAYVDGNGNLREQTNEDRIAEAAPKVQAKTQVNALGRSVQRSATLSSEPSSGGEYPAEQGATAYDPGDEAAVYMVVKKTPNGLVKSEHTGQAAAEKAVRTKAEKEVRNDR